MLFSGHIFANKLVLHHNTVIYITNFSLIISLNKAGIRNISLHEGCRTCYDYKLELARNYNIQSNLKLVYLGLLLVIII